MRKQVLYYSDSKSCVKALEGLSKTVRLIDMLLQITQNRHNVDTKLSPVTTQLSGFLHKLLAVSTQTANPSPSLFMKVFINKSTDTTSTTTLFKIKNKADIHYAT